MDEFFGPSGRLAAALPGFEPRAGQAALAQAVADALESDEHLLAEAGTGTGKSLAYLVPRRPRRFRSSCSRRTFPRPPQLSDGRYEWLF
jgi:hypothetical protein